jgi:hypothetical protein
MEVASHSGKNFPDVNIPKKNGGSSHCIVVGESYTSSDVNSDYRRLGGRIADSGVPAEFRADQRFSVNMELRYSYRSSDLTYIGTGRTSNLSNTAICFEIDQEVMAGGDIEVRIAWPSRLQHVCSLELVLRGRIVRKGPNFAVLQIASYEFQTFGDRSFNSLNSRGVTCNIAA